MNSELLISPENLADIIAALQKYSTWHSRGKLTLELIPCPFCGEKPEVIATHSKYGWSGAAVRCPRCEARGPRASIYAVINKGDYAHLLPGSLGRGIQAAIDAWNRKTVDHERLGNLRITVGDAVRR